MGQKTPRYPRPASSVEPRMHAFPILPVLVMNVIVLDHVPYPALLPAGSTNFLEFFGWLCWTRHCTRCSR